MDLTAVAIGAMAGGGVAGALASGISSTSDVAPYSIIGTVVTPVAVLSLLFWGKLHLNSDYQGVKTDRDLARAELKAEREERKAERDRASERYEKVRDEAATELYPTVARNTSMLEANTQTMVRVMDRLDYMQGPDRSRTREPT